MFSHGMYDLHDFARVCPSRHPCLIPCWLMIRTGWSHAWLRFESKVRSPQLVSPTASVPRLEQRQQTQLLAARASGPDPTAATPHLSLCSASHTHIHNAVLGTRSFWGG